MYCSFVIPRQFCTSDVSISMCFMFTIYKVLDRIFVMYKMSIILIFKYSLRRPVWKKNCPKILIPLFFNTNLSTY